MPIVTRKDQIVAAYMECAVWASIWGEDGKSLDQMGYTVDSLSPDAKSTMRKDVMAFLGDCTAAGLDLSDIPADQIGHDFWLTRNGHGAGFWDRGLGELGDKLTALCKPYGESYLILESDITLGVD